MIFRPTIWIKIWCSILFSILFISQLSSVLALGQAQPQAALAGKNLHSQTAQALVFGPYDTLFGYGIVGQDLLEKTGEQDASGNIRFQDIGIFLRDRILAYFKGAGKDVSLKYIDPSYTIRSVPADANDSAFCLLLGQNAVHAGMAGRTNIVVGFWAGEFTHVPISMATSKRKKLDPDGWVWNSVITITGQPREMR